MSLVTEHPTLGDILRNAEGSCRQCGAKTYGSPDSRCPKCGEVNNPQIAQVPRLPEQVEKFAASVETRFGYTAEMLIRTAEKLETRAEDLRSKARWLLEQRGLANDIREAVSFEQTSMDEVKSLALVDVGMRQDT